MKAKKYYVTMTDKFLSGWGRAEGKINKFVIEVPTLNHAEVIKKNAMGRTDMKNINILARKPSYNRRRYFVSNRTYGELGDAWKKGANFYGV